VRDVRTLKHLHGRLIEQHSLCRSAQLLRPLMLCMWPVATRTQRLVCVGPVLLLTVGEHSTCAHMTHVTCNRAHPRMLGETHPRARACPDAILSGITLRGPDPSDGAAVVSGGTRIEASSWRPAGPGMPGVWMADIPSTDGVLAASRPTPRQLWVAAGGDATAATAQRRTRARHPNLYDDATGSQLQQFPYMFWASPISSCSGLEPSCKRAST
jgi:hypothetical protein